MFKKGYFQISFAWLFAIIAGAFILFLAIFTVVNILEVGETSIDSETAKQIGVLLNPLETNYQGVRATTLTVPSETRINNICDVSAGKIFGQQKIQVNQKSFGKWTEQGLEVGFENKYIFSERTVEGKRFHLISVPFNYPFKVANIITIIPETETYCFVDAPRDVLDDILNLESKGIQAQDCESAEQSVKICFNSESSCDIYVNYDENSKGGWVEKGSDLDRLYFSDGLLYGAIFSDQGIYECQIKRLMSRVSELSSIYQEKANFVELKGCHSNVNAELSRLITETSNFQNSQDLTFIDSSVKNTKNKNDPNVRCRLW